MQALRTLSIPHVHIRDLLQNNIVFSSVQRNILDFKEEEKFDPSSIYSTPKNVHAI